MISDILKFEYMTQLLLDSNYLPLILKMFAHQEIDQAVAQRTDREQLGYGPVNFPLYYPKLTLVVSFISVICIQNSRQTLEMAQTVKMRQSLLLFLDKDQKQPERIASMKLGKVSWTTLTVLRSTSWAIQLRRPPASPSQTFPSAISSRQSITFI